MTKCAPVIVDAKSLRLAIHSRAYAPLLATRRSRERGGVAGSGRRDLAPAEVEPAPAEALLDMPGGHGSAKVVEGR